MNPIQFLFGTKRARDVKKLRPIVRRINELDEQYKSLSDDELRAILGDEAGTVSAASVRAAAPDYEADALAALQSLGYTPQEARRALDKCRGMTEDANELLRLALRSM